MPTVLLLSPLDNVAVAVDRLAAGNELAWGVVRQTIPMGHKVAVREIAQGEAVIKYGQVIGFASQAIAKGDHVHSHNLQAKLFAREYAFGESCPKPMPAPADANI